MQEGLVSEEKLNPDLPTYKSLLGTFYRQKNKSLDIEKCTSCLSCCILLTFFPFPKTWLFCWNQEKEKPKKYRDSGIGPVTFPRKEKASF